MKNRVVLDLEHLDPIGDKICTVYLQGINKKQIRLSFDESEIPFLIFWS